MKFCFQRQIGILSKISIKIFEVKNVDFCVKVRCLNKSSILE